MRKIIIRKNEKVDYITIFFPDYLQINYGIV